VSSFSGSLVGFAVSGFVGAVGSFGVGVDFELVEHASRRSGTQSTRGAVMAGPRAYHFDTPAEPP
jgi:hypothetical protein